MGKVALPFVLLIFFKHLITKSDASSQVKKNLFILGPVDLIKLFFDIISSHIGKTDPVDHAILPNLTQEKFVVEKLIHEITIYTV